MRWLDEVGAEVLDSFSLMQRGLTVPCTVASLVDDSSRCQGAEQLKREASASALLQVGASLNVSRM